MIIPLTCCVLFLVFITYRFFLKKSTFEVAFFHPFCAGRGGGERVLWHCIKALQSRYGNAIRISVYCADDIASQSTAEIISSAKRCFAIDHLDDIRFIKCKSYRLIDPKLYTFLTMILQNLGSVLVGIECLMRFRPGLFIDTTGFAFIYPVARYLFGCRVACYTHYPTISTDMLSQVMLARPSHNNKQRIASSQALTRMKLYYYRMFAWIYSYVGKSAHLVMVNSSWTRNHIELLWQTSCTVVYPPCEIDDLSQIPLNNRLPWLISVAQFRPEKDHMLQLEAFATVLSSLKEHRDRIRLVLVGGARNADDRKLVDDLVEKAKQLKIEDNVEIYTNASYDELRALYSKCLIGLHTMWNEHFGIGVVEYMAAGLVTIAHNSGGPQLDIVVPFKDKPVGFLADSTPMAFSDRVVFVLDTFLNRNDDLADLRSNARAHCQKFSNQRFKEAFLSVLAPLLL